MVYSARIRLAAVTAFLIHLVGLILLPFFLQDARHISVVEAVQRPIILNFDQVEPKEPKRLIETAAPAEQPVEGDEHDQGRVDDAGQREREPGLGLRDEHG